MNFDWNQNFWIVNMVCNYAYSRWSEVYPEVAEEIVEREQEGFDLVAILDKDATDLIN